MTKKNKKNTAILTIAGKTYRVRLVKKLETAGGEYYGIIDTQKRDVLVSDHDIEDFEDTILHETIHAISNSFLLELTEKQTTRLSVELYDFLRRNKNIKFNMNKLRGELGNV